MDRSRGLTAIIGLWGLCALFIAGPAWADGNPFVGRWRLNKVQSKLPPGEVMPADLVADFLISSQHSCQMDDHRDGCPGAAFRRVVRYSGKRRVLPSQRQFDRGVQLERQGPLGHVQRASGRDGCDDCVLSVDQRKMTCNGVLSSGNGKTETYVDVYDRN